MTGSTADRPSGSGQRGVGGHRALGLAEAAARYAAAGWPVIPLHEIRDRACSCAAGPACPHPGRHPRTPSGHRDATTDRELVARWWRRWPTSNLAAANGAVSGLVVIDLDGPDGAATWAALEAEHGAAATATAQTPHGRHLWYRTPAGLAVPRRIRGLGPGVDLLGDGGYALLPPSDVPCLKAEHRAAGLDCGDRYAWTGPRPLAELPHWVIQQLRAREPAPTPTPPIDPGGRRTARPYQGGGYGQAALAGEAARVATAPQGSQNDTLNYAAWRLGQLVGGGELDADHVRAALLQAAHACGHIDRDGLAQAARTIESGLAAGIKQPRRRPHQRSAEGRSRSM